jgi:hypothetical protein
MTTPKLCPVCGSQSVNKILADTLLAAYVNGLTTQVVGVLAYHCGAGHVFLVMGDDFKFLESSLDGSGHSLFV